MVKKRKSKKRGVLNILLIILLSIFLFTIAAGIGITLAIIKSAPEIDANILDNLKQSSKIYDKDGNFIEDFSDIQNRTIVPLNKIPRHVQNAFIAIEDERFWKHHGIDPKRILGAIWYDIKTMSKAQGASTITQQLIKNIALSPKKDFSRKIQEMYLALQLERKLSKEQILEAYLNTIYLGGNAYGIQAASMYYFGKDVSELTVAEAALIAGLTQSPYKYYPYSKKNKENPKVYLDRQRTVLKKMLEQGYITQSEYNEAINQKLVFKSKESSNTMKYQWFIEAAIDQIAKDMANKLNISEGEAKQKLRTGGYNIYLTLDTKIQKAAEDILNNDSYFKQFKLQPYSPDEKSPEIIQPQAAAVIMDPFTGEVRALVGGRGPHPLRSINRATEVKRQPGSAIKPLAVYAPAIDLKIATAATVIDDTPFSKDLLALTGGWQPKNYDFSYRGKVTVREAITRSINVVASKLLLEIGISNSLNYLQNKFHISTITNSDKYVAPLSLGGLTEGVYPIEMAAAYGVFANKGIYSEPILYTLVTDRYNNIILEKKPNQTKAISSQAAYIMLDMMKDVVRKPYGTGSRARFGSMPVAGKTGTTSDYTNVWFCGVTPYYSGVVWIGHDKPNKSIPGLKSSLAAKIWGDIMKHAHEGLKVKDFPRPAGLIYEKVCPISGKYPNEYCPKTITEIFIEGTQPVEICDYHSAPSLPNETTPNQDNTQINQQDNAQNNNQQNNTQQDNTQNNTPQQDNPQNTQQNTNITSQ
ncbi:penicillin-binding protein 1A [Caloramator fervidus]|uniref:Penicillin-binding protein 1A n=1 Tax=Caloramator fervidus TaxID=29344 RepID=A0A1H5SVV6_9CLOT|nr:PBP1A family penicillin-binding protein [Caloramator fervidus]SEF54732.1 penicillin-binding protein 1A [Caloramator fervidus]